MDEKMNQFKSRVILGEAKTPSLVVWLVKLGLTKNQRLAGRILIALSVAFFAASFYFFSTVGSYAALFIR